MPVDLPWTDQPAARGTLRAEMSWEGKPGTAAGIASALRGWQLLRFEVTEDASPGSDGMRYSGTPTLGLFGAVIGASGNVLVPEERLHSALASAGSGDTTLQAELDRLLGRAWDDELEPFRYAGDGAPVRWLHAAV